MLQYIRNVHSLDSNIQGSEETPRISTGLFFGFCCEMTLEQFQYLETTLKNQNSIHEEIKNRLKLEDAGYNSVQSLLSSSLLSKSVKIKIYREL
jgi:hypothetical protein